MFLELLTFRVADVLALLLLLLWACAAEALAFADTFFAAVWFLTVSVVAFGAASVFTPSEEPFALWLSLRTAAVALDLFAMAELFFKKVAF